MKLLKIEISKDTNDDRTNLALKLELSIESNLTLPIMEHAKVMIAARPMCPRARHVTARHRQDGGASSTRPITGRANCFPS